MDNNTRCLVSDFGQSEMRSEAYRPSRTPAPDMPIILSTMLTTPTIIPRRLKLPNVQFDNVVQRGRDFRHTVLSTWFRMFGWLGIGAVGDGHSWRCAGDRELVRYLVYSTT